MPTNIVLRSVLLSLLISACQTVREEPPELTDDVVRFVNDVGEKVSISIFMRKIEFPGRVVALEDCSDAQFNCFASDRFRIIAPKTCNAESMKALIRNESVRFLGFYHDPGNVLLGGQDGQFAYLFSQANGISIVFYDPSGQLTAGKSGFDWQRAKKAMYETRSGAGVLKCALR